ncbi:MAG: hypothetical protein SF123_06605, partial [Chloroflexota bacterium]|nr:hypothetical protein [Chloroflexota bacterium]
MFVSQAVWAGGLPMTSGNPTSCDVTPTGSPGWRYCRNLNGASNPWDFHQEFVAYHTNFDVPGVPFVNFPTSILTGSNLGRQLTFAGCGTVQTDRISSGSSLTDSAGQDLEAYFEFNGSDLLGDRTGILKMFQGSKPIFNKSSIVVDRL